MLKIVILEANQIMAYNNDVKKSKIIYPQGLQEFASTMQKKQIRVAIITDDNKGLIFELLKYLPNDRKYLLQTDLYEKGSQAISEVIDRIVASYNANSPNQLAKLADVLYVTSDKEKEKAINVSVHFFSSINFDQYKTSVPSGDFFNNIEDTINAIQPKNELSQNAPNAYTLFSASEEKAEPEENCCKSLCAVI